MVSNVAAVVLSVAEWRLADRSLHDSCVPVVAIGDGRGPVEQVGIGSSVAVEEASAGATQLIFTALPPQVDGSTFLEVVADQVRTGRLCGISDLSDHSEFEPAALRLIITLRIDADPGGTLATLLELVREAQQDSHARAHRLRQVIRGRIPPGGAAANSELAAIEFSREDCEYLLGQVQRQRRDGDNGETNSAASVTAALELALHGPQLEPIQVATGRTDSGLEWSIRVDGRRDLPNAQMTVSQAGHHFGTCGYDLNPIAAGSLIHAVGSSSYSGQATLLVVAVAEVVDRVTVNTSHRVDIEVPLSDPDPQLSLRYGIQALPPIQRLRCIRAEAAGEVIESRDFGQERR